MVVRPLPCGLRRPAARGVLLGVLAPLALGAAGCAGIFQRPMPAAPAEYAVRASGELRVGAAERDVTPAIGCWLAGFSPARASTAIQSPLKVRALVVECGGRPFAIVGIDNLGVMREDADWIKAGIAGFANGDVVLCASHTHAGPDLIGLWGFYALTSGRDPDYLAALRAAVAAAVAEARAAAAPAEFAWGEENLPGEGLIKNANTPQLFDRRLVVLHATERGTGRPLGTLLHFACHPEILPRRSTAISSDFVGALCDSWREQGRGQAVFVNGALGAMISPAVQPRDATGIAKFAAVVQECAERALAGAAPLPVDAIEVRRRDVFLPVRSLGFRIGRLATVLPRELYDGNARSTVGWLRIGAFEAVLVPGEMEPVLAQEIRAELRRPRLCVFGLCDDEVGYLLRDVDARDPEYAYERSMSTSTDAGERVRAAITGGSDTAASR